MAQALLHIAVGPVQDFIAAARRTRDLWFGSHVLSEVSKAAARAIRAYAGAELIFPVPHLTDDDIDPLEGTLEMFLGEGDDRRPVIPSPNKLWAVVTADTADAIASRVERVAAAAERSAQAQWQAFADRVGNPRFERKLDSHTLIDPHRRGTWKEQIDRLLEVFAAWCPLADEADATFRQARIELISAVENAKTLRVFSQWTPASGAPRQSSLDAARYDVLIREAHTRRGGRRYRIASGESLSAVDLVKRAGGEPEQFVPVTNIALAPWHAHAKARHRKAWDIVEDAMETFARRAGKDVFGFDRTGQVPRETLNAGHWTMHYDAQIFLENRAIKTLEEAIGRYRGKSPEANDAQATAAREVERAVAGLLARVGAQPVPYVACLMGDGDGLGNVLMTLGPAASREASEALCRFSVETSRIIDDRLGLPIYAGGDDVLALVPLETAASCAADLNAAYHRLVGPIMRANGAQASFSVGIGIGHVLDPLRDLLDLGRAAERLAKGNDLPRAQQRRAVAVILEKRGGQRRTWRARWPLDGSPDPPARIAAAVALMGDDRLSTRKLFELDDLLRRLHVADPAGLGERDAQALCGALRTMAARILARSEGRGGRAVGADTPLTPAAVNLDLDGPDYETVRTRLEGWIELHVIARLVADATYQTPLPLQQSRDARRQANREGERP